VYHAPVDFAYSGKVEALRAQLREFMQEHVYPSERVYAEQLGTERWIQPPVMEELKARAQKAGLWNLFLPGSERGAGLSNLEYAPLAEIMGRSPIAPEVFNCNAPDTGNMEVLERYGSAEHKKEWLEPLLEGRIRSAFCMTEPDVASSDATNISCEIRRHGADYLINGRKWWTSGILHPHCEILIVMGKSDPAAARHAQQSQILVPRRTRGVEVVRHLPEIAQGRLGPGRIHHCMRLVGVAERALEAMCRRVTQRVAFGKPLAEQTVTQERIAEARIAIEQARLLTLRAAWAMDTAGNKAARKEIAMIKVAAPKMALQVLDWSIQAHGAAGVGEDFPLAAAWAHSRALRIADGPDEVHRNQIARLELREQGG
jgi:acyl-CoA dehydrogenase